MSENTKEPELPPPFSSEEGPAILIVDDLQDNLDLLETLLREEGYGSLYFATSGREALSILDQVPELALVLLDVMMPEMDGYEVCRRIRANPKSAHIPVIVVTGGAIRHGDALRRSYAAGATDFIQKPVNEIELYSRVRTALLLYRERISSRLKTKELQLRQTQEMADIAELSGSMAREIKAILTIMDKCSRVILDHKGLPRAVEDSTRTIMEVVKEAEKWTRDPLAAGQTSIVDCGGGQLKAAVGHPDLEELSALGANQKAVKRRSRGDYKKQTILLVEDEPDLRAITATLLLENGYRVLSACSGVEALALWEQSVIEVDLLLSDVVISSDISGPELAGKLLKKKPDLKVLFTSGYRLDEISFAGEMPRGFSFIQKPYGAISLTKIIRKVMASPAV